MCDKAHDGRNIALKCQGSDFVGACAGLLIESISTTSVYVSAIPSTALAQFTHTHMLCTVRGTHHPPHLCMCEVHSYKGRAIAPVTIDDLTLLGERKNSGSSYAHLSHTTHTSPSLTHHPSHIHPS